MATKIIYKLDKNNNFEYVIVKDHTSFAEKGKDIVCAAISAITNGTINFLATYYEKNCQISILPAQITITPFNYNSNCQLCLKLMLFQLENVAKNYPNYLKMIRE